MSTYITLGSNDSEKSNVFYDAVLATIDWKSHLDFPGWRAYSEQGKGENFTLWIAQPFNQQAATAGNGTMVGFSASTHAEVDAFYAAAMANGGSDDGAPGLRPHYGPHWYAAYMRDPTGNKIAIVCNQ
ncbi:VOC family protein [Iodobacter sp. CM08]|nr:VOC family protein [Iodobacter sp. CM08]